MTPWNLTASQEKAVQLLIEYGSDKGVAAHLGRSVETVAEHLRLARIKMGVGSRVHIALTYDRWQRAQGAAK